MSYVGYQTEDWMSQGGYYLMGAQFQNTTGEDIALADIDFGIAPEDVPVYNKTTWKSVCPQVQIGSLDSEGSTPYYYVRAKANSAPAWYDNGAKVANVKIAPGVAFWFRDPASSAPKFTISGQVLDDVVWQKTFYAGRYYAITCPYPISVNIADVQFDGIDDDAAVYDKGNIWKSTATQIQLPDGQNEGNIPYYYVKPSATKPADWYDNGAKKASGLVIPAGRGFWFRPKGDITMTFTFPAN